MLEREGQRIGNYHLLRLLGKGAQASVYLGEHLYLKNYAAIKILHTSLNEKNEDLFLSEARTIAQLTHSNIVRVREFAIERSTPYLVMDYAPGGTLRHRYPKGTCLSLEKTVSYVKQIAAALQYAHNRGIIHRDVKPENVLQGSEQVLLSDFGISIYSSEPNTINTRAGTRPYMAPEQFRGKAVFASDQYALAVLAYEWLCGVRPFEGSPISLEYQHEHVTPPRLREKDPSLPETVEMVILKALSKKPEDRYVSIIGFARALERASQDSSSEIAPDTSTGLLDTPHPILSRRVFLSSASSDDCTPLQTDLMTRHIFVQDDSASEPQEEKMRQTIRAAQVVLLLLTPRTRSSTAVQDHLRIAGLYQRRIICVWQQGDDLYDLLPVDAEQAMIIDARGQRYKEALDEIIISLEQEYRGTAHSETRLPEYDLEPRNPYKGLLAFTQNDRADFFGRASVVQELLAWLKKRAYSAPTEESAARFLTIVGPSGSGKSSVVMAGLLPKLQEGALPGSEEWVYLDPMVPGKQPLEALVHLLAAHLPEKEQEDIREMLGRDGGFGLHKLALTLVRQPERRVVLTIDQFEELFSSSIPERERQHFIDLLVTAATEPDGPVVVLLTLRADFYDRPLVYPTLGRLIQQQQCVVLPMSVEDLREVIERPALLPDVRLLFEEDLVGDLLFDMRGQMGALPLLEFALEQLFHHRRERRLTRRAYQEIGGVRGALSKQAESTYEALPSEGHRRLARTLFIRLVQLGAQGQEPLRRRAVLSEFDLVEASEKQQMQETLEAFIQARLLTTSQSDETTTIEVSHEAVIRQWKRLADWLHEAYEDIRFQQSLSEDVTEWNRRKRPQDRLYRGVQLKEAREWTKRNKPSEQEAAFLRASVMRRSLWLVSLSVVALLLVSLTGVAGWLDLTRPPDPTLVTTLQDNVNGSLRYCIEHAQSGSTINFDSHLQGTIELRESLEFLSGEKLTIKGLGANKITISGGRNTYASIQVPPGATLNISGVSFKDSQTFNNAFLFNEGTLAVTNSIISNNKNLSGSTAFGGGIENSGGTLTLINSTISNNTANGTRDRSQGGGIYNEGKLTVINSTISGNMSISTNDTGHGGGISNATIGTLTLTNSIISNNTATSTSKNGQGGGIDNEGKLTMTNSTISNNTANSASGNGLGGGIINAGPLTVANSIISHNTATSTSGYAAGGAIANQGLATVTNSTISNNTASNTSGYSLGGGISNTTLGKLTIINSTLSNNTATSISQDGQGGGILNNGTITLTNSTFLGNVAMSTNSASFGGGIDSYGTDSNMTLSMSIVAANKAQQDLNISGPLTSKGYNLIQSTTGVTGLSATDQQVTLSDLNLDPTLRNNGGPTQTLALLSGSVAIDAVPIEACHITITDAVSGNPITITTDQRGNPRPDGSENMCDIGAYESAY